MRRRSLAMRSLVAAVATAVAIPIASADPISWVTIVNNGTAVPGTAASFNSYNQPAVSSSGTVVFRGRGRLPTGSGGGEGELAVSAATSSDSGSVVEGIFLRDMLSAGALSAVTLRGEAVPQPNNLSGTFNEFPSSPRIDATSSFIVTRGQSTPVYRYLLADGVTETRVGTSGVYAGSGGPLATGASLLGAVQEVQPDLSYGLSFPYYSVPDAPAGTRFDQFPGSPTAFDASKVAFKGNFTDPSDGLGKTGVYYRDILAAGGKSPTSVIASANTRIPNQPAGGSVNFGATAAPSAANGYIVFTGWDNEDAPTMGGVYRAPLSPSPPLQTLAAIGQQVPGEAGGATFTNFGEGLSISEDGRYVAFFATWGSEATQKVLFCPADGNVDRIAYCNSVYPAGFTVGVPLHQGIFVVDAQTGAITPIAKTMQEGISDFTFWVYSGAPPGTGGGTEGPVDESREAPRWRSSAFVALAAKPGQVYGTSLATSDFQAAFKATRNGVDGIYLRRGGIDSPLETVVETLLSSGQSVDASAPAGSIVTAVGIERDGFRDQNLAVAVSMLYETVDTSLGWAGLYLARIPPVDMAHTADLSITQTTAFDDVAFASDVSFTLNVVNSGPSPATNVVVRNLLPGGSTFVSASPGCSAAFGTVTCEIGSLASGASTQLSVTVHPGVGDSMTNSADVRGREWDVATSNNASSKSVRVTSGLGAAVSNLSTRGLALTGDNVQIAGFIVGGTSSKAVVVRGRGPSLTAYGVANALRNPRLTLVRMSDHAVIETNDDWGKGANAPQLAATGFAPGNASEPAILMTLSPGAYTAILSGEGPDDTGVGIAEVFEVDHPESQLVNISTRGPVIDGDGVMIAGFIVQGTGRQLVVIRARGPSLAAAGVSNPLPNPTLSLVRMSDGQEIAANNDWNVQNLNATAIQQRGMAPANGYESAIMIALDAGAYTAIVKGLGNTSGTAIVEVFCLPETSP